MRMLMGTYMYMSMWVFLFMSFVDANAHVYDDIFDDVSIYDDGNCDDADTISALVKLNMMLEFVMVGLMMMTMT